MNIVFDIGGTNMRVATAEGETLGEIRKVPTPQEPEEAIAQFVAVAKELANGPIARVVGSCRGRVVDGVLVSDKILYKWNGTPLAKQFSEALGAPVEIGHDTSFVGLGEARVGSGQGARTCVYVTVSTGVGGGRIVEGNIDHGVYYPEIGRMLVDGIQLEDLISGTAIQKKFGISPKELDSLEERNKLADILAVGLYNSTLHWTPDVFVLGGSMIVGVNPIPLERTEQTLSKLVLETYPTAPAVRMATLGDNGGLIGAAILAAGR